MRLSYHSSASVELADAVRYYRERSHVLGARFLEAARQALEAMQKAPGRWRPVFGDARGCRIKDFPSTICYRVSADRIRVYAFKHDRRRPGYWVDRLSE